MKSIVLFAMSALALSGQVGAAEILDAKLDAQGLNILATVKYGGGLSQDHKFSLKLKGCFETMPVQCKAELIHISNDAGEALLIREIKLSLAENGLVGNYFANGHLTILGDNDSKVAVKLPAVLPPAVTRPGIVACVTHTGSLLEIDTRAQRVTLQAQTGESAVYSIVGVNTRSLESLPPVLQTTYKLNDGRSIVTSFRGSDKKGTGVFVRLTGELSPSFECNR